ncbi:MAG TPA: ParA family protein [Anaerolineales bacterium]|nr:ParA family protein [Anaerolineales bacterium]
MAYTIAISNEKGGVAKTTSTLSLGAALTEVAQKVLLIDLDPQANLTLALGFEPGKSEHTSSDILLDATPLLGSKVETHIPNLDLVPANAGLEQAEQVLPIYLNYTTRLRNAIEAAKPLPYEVVMIDCPPSLGAITINALTAADLLIIPTQAEYFSAYALRDMMTVIRQVRAEDNPKLAYRILVTLLDQRNRTHRDIREQLERTFGFGLFKTVIEIDTKLRESPILGMAITQYKPNSRGALQYRSLAEELIQYVKQTNSETA